MNLWALLSLICFLVAFAVSFTARYADWTVRLIALGLALHVLPAIT